MHLCLLLGCSGPLSLPHFLSFPLSPSLCALTALAFLIFRHALPRLLTKLLLTLSLQVHISSSVESFLTPTPEVSFGALPRTKCVWLASTYPLDLTLPKSSCYLSNPPEPCQYQADTGLTLGLTQVAWVMS